MQIDSRLQWCHSRRTMQYILLFIVAPFSALLLGMNGPIAEQPTYLLSATDGEWSAARDGSGATPTCLRYRNTPDATDENLVAFGQVSSACVEESDLTRQSGFGFKGKHDVPQTVNVGEPFLLGELTHYNHAIAASTLLELVDITMTLKFDASDELIPLNFTLQLDETFNTGACAFGQPEDTPCPDEIRFRAADLEQSFMLNGIPHKLQFFGFAAGDLTTCEYDANTVTNSYISQETMSNPTCLFARILIPSADLVLTKIGPLQAPVGEIVDYTLAVTNLGPDPATTVVIDDIRILKPENALKLTDIDPIV